MDNKKEQYLFDEYNPENLSHIIDTPIKILKVKACGISALLLQQTMDLTLIHLYNNNQINKYIFIYFYI